MLPGVDDGLATSPAGPSLLFAALRMGLVIVALIATTDRIYQVRQNRLLGNAASMANHDYVDRASIAEELAYTRKLCARQGWPMIDVSRKSIEETAAAIMELRARHLAAQTGGYDS